MTTTLPRTLSPPLFWYEHMGRFLHPEPDDPILGPSLSLTRMHDHAEKPLQVRLGSGKAAALVSPQSSILMADIRSAKELPSHVTLMPCSWRSTPNWMAEVLLAPPSPPFMFIVFGKNPHIMDRLRVTASPDVVRICGAETMDVRLEPVRAALAVVTGAPSATWRAAVRLRDERDRKPGRTAQIDQQLEAMLRRTPGLAAALETIPRPGTDEFAALSLIDAVQRKQGGKAG